ncbi:zinc finger protein 502-like [Prorops nasuta]|uniref:zinc finger protein 502-like n=1 Tax=Prorops nasuta TaxID=863751 RepID=UPI0034CF5EDB
MSYQFFDMTLNMDRICRICLIESTNLTPIFGSGQNINNYIAVANKIQICGSIDIQEQDGFPSLICEVCAYKAAVAYEFRQQCQNSDAKLRLYFNKPSTSTAVKDSSTQTDGHTKFVSLKQNQPENYYVKEELQVSSNPQKFIQSERTYNNAESAIRTSQLDMTDQKLFICSGEFDEPECIDKETSILESNIHQLPMSESDVNTHDINRSMYIQDKSLKSDEINQPILKGCTEQKNYNSHQFHELNVIESELFHQKHTSRKMSPLKLCSGDEIDYNYDKSITQNNFTEKTFKCKICSKEYATQKSLSKHYHTHENKHKCDICLKMFYKEKNMEKHKKIHTLKPYSCELCCSCFSKSGSLLRHLKSHEKPINNVLKKINPEEQNEDTRPKKELITEEDTDNEANQTIEANDFKDAPEIYKCEICGQYCSSLKTLKRHTLIHGDKKYSCTVCKKWFFRPDTLKKHAEKHGHGLLDNLIEDNKLFDSDDDSFPIDDKKTGQEQNKVKKEDSEEDSSGEYKCQHCEKIMTTKKGLRRHVSIHKPKAEPVTCEICKKICASQARLLLHQRTHIPKEKVAREYLCHICSKVYPSNSSLTYHMRTHTGIKPHICKTCNNGFTTTTSLANHIRIHTGDKPFVCHVCSAAFAVSSAFKRHLTRHTGEANYLCKICGKAFKRLSTLKEHTYTHSGEKPYVCKTCGAAYSHSGSLFAHQKRCRNQYGELVDAQHHHHTIAHIHVNDVQSAVRSLTVIGQMY